MALSTALWGLIRIRREARLAAGLYGCLADLLGRLGRRLGHLLERRSRRLTRLLDRLLGGLADLLGRLLGGLSSAATGEATKRLLGDVADLGGLADHAAMFAVVSRPGL